MGRISNRLISHAENAELEIGGPRARIPREPPEKPVSSRASDLSRRSPQGGAGSGSRDPPNPPAEANRGRGRGSPAVGHSLATVRHDARRASVSQRLSRAHHSPGKSGDPSTRPPGGLARDDSGRDAELGLGGPGVGGLRAGGFRSAPGSENGLQELSRRHDLEALVAGNLQKVLVSADDGLAVGREGARYELIIIPVSRNLTR